MSVSSNRRISSCLFWYMARQFALPFCCALLAFMAMFLLNDVLNDLSDCLENNVAMHRVVIFFLTKQVHNIINVIPISVLLAASFMTIMLGRNNELTAMRAAGLSLAKCALPIWLISILAAGFVFLVNESWGPKCTKIAQSIEMMDMYQNEYFNHLTFHHPSQRRDWAIDEVKQDGSFSKIIVRQYRKDGSTDYLVTAVSAVFADGKWTFRDGYVQTYDAEKQRIASQEYFDEKEMPFPESPGEINAHSNRPENMNIRELKSVLNNRIVSSHHSRNMMKALLWNKLTLPLITLVGALFGVALTISTDRKSAIKGFVGSIVILIANFFFSQMFLVLAENGYLHPFIGGALPNLSFFAAGVLTMRARQ